MDKLKKKIKELTGKLYSKQGKITSIIFLVVSVVFIFFSTIIYSGKFVDIIWGFDGVLIIILLFSMAVAASLVVMDSLLHIGAGLSLIIFLSQSYCGATNYTVDSDNALKSLLIIGLMYVVYDFIKTLYLGLQERLENIKSTKRGFEKFSTIILFIAFAFMFVVAIYRVMNPIITSFCVYHR